jgi:peptidoglycan/LPS O-acetylase OafA/YrhL
MTATISNTISFLRFPLACMIVIFHYYTPDISAEVLSETCSTVQMGGGYWLVGEFTKVFPIVAVPLFFFISGFLYFANLSSNEFSLEVWKEKSLNRVKSLVIPYIAWNLLILALFAVMQSLTGNSSNVQKEGYKLIADYQLIDWFKAVWAIDSTGLPVDGPLWFVRDLMVTSFLFAGPVYWLMKATGVFGLLALFVLKFCGFEFPFPGVSMSCIFFFSWGALCSIKKFDLLTGISMKTSLMFDFIIVFSLLIFAAFHISRSPFESLFADLYIYATVGLVFGGLAPFVRLGALRAVPVLATASFFIFAMHKPVQVIIRRYSFAILHPHSEVLLSLMVLVVPMLTILICLASFYVIKRWLPSLKFLNGFRL